MVESKCRIMSLLLGIKLIGIRIPTNGYIHPHTRYDFVPDPIHCVVGNEAVAQTRLVSRRPPSGTCIFFLIQMDYPDASG